METAKFESSVVNMAEQIKTSQKPRSRVHPTDNDEIQLPEEVSFPLVPTHNLNESPDPDIGESNYN